MFLGFMVGFGKSSSFYDLLWERNSRWLSVRLGEGALG